MNAIRITSVLSDFLRPPHCLACGAAEAWPCCAACLPPEPAGPGPWRLAADPSVTMWALGLYGDAMRAAVLAGKFRGQSAALRALGRRLGAQLLDAGLGADLVTWVAARPARGLPRDHADQIAAGVAAALELPTVSLLAPAAGRDLGKSRAGIRAAGPQAVELPSSAHHAAGPEAAGNHAVGPQAGGRPRDAGVIAAGLAAEGLVRPPPRVLRRLDGGRILLVDDVATTGSTLAGAAAALYEAGARQVEVAVLGAAPTAFGPPAPPGRPRGVGLRQVSQPP
jgi:predicted amidophosphoribosyltransferase